ncbi:MAG: MBL fold metallo-hydrolase [Xanthomonadaceae bacterium]|nr:MBL fold metallo-hydrolase [Xanthomonadaceae bacterium]
MTEHAIYTIDTGYVRPDYDAAYLLVEQGRGAFIDCGTNHSIPRLLAALDQAGLAAEDVDWVIPTHVHLDHAGGAGGLMRRLPNARLLIHPRGAAHMIDPAKLVAGSIAVYGEKEFARLYGEIVPIPEERVVVAEDGHVAELAGRPLLCIDTPGHARHHMCIWDERSRSWFSGDTFGLSYRQMDSSRGAFILPSSSPVQFEPDALKASIGKLLARQPEKMHLTHYGTVSDPAKLGRDLVEQIDVMVEVARASDGKPERHQDLIVALSDYYLHRARAHRCPLSDEDILDLLHMDIELNAQGLEVWLDRRQR